MTQIFDRGSKKLVSFIMPEHREALKKWFEEEVKERPELDEQEVERLNRALTHAFRAGRQVAIRYWDDGEREIVGRIVRYEVGTLRLMTEDGKVHIDVEKILDVV